MLKELINPSGKIRQKNNLSIRKNEMSTIISYELIISFS